MTDYEAVSSCVKWLESKLKDLKLSVEEKQKEARYYARFEDCGDTYQEWYIQEKQKFDTTLEIKIGMEKYAKKLKHISEEIKNVS